MKKLNKQILEAVNKGIKLALDDFDDIQDQNPILSKKKILNYDAEKDMYLYENAIDLGLPSGTLWCKYNLGVDPKKLNIAEDWVGNYYAWGELKPKKTYKVQNYKFFPKWDYEIGRCRSDNVSKYNDRIDFETVLKLEDDAAYNTLGNNWKIPSVKDFEELKVSTTKKFVNYKKLNVYGVEFIGKNGNSIFIPLSGEHDGERDEGIINDYYGYFWLCERSYKHYESIACLASICSVGCCVNYTERYIGLPIRPILKK